MRFNTAIFRLMELSNALVAATERPREVVETLILLLSPFAPHIAKELWGKLDHKGTLAFVPWPSFAARKPTTPIDMLDEKCFRITV
jgi:leucyl-tRNA synthetase